jgi:hypothetical protein
MPTRLRSQADGARVVISCLVSDIEMTVSLAPHPRGCAVDFAVSVPDGEASRLADMRRLATASLARLAERSSRPGGAFPEGPSRRARRSR